MSQITRLVLKGGVMKRPTQPRDLPTTKLSGVFLSSAPGATLRPSSPLGRVVLLVTGSGLAHTCRTWKATPFSMPAMLSSFACTFTCSLSVPGTWVERKSSPSCSWSIPLQPFSATRQCALSTELSCRLSRTFSFRNSWTLHWCSLWSSSTSRWKRSPPSVSREEATWLALGETPVQWPPLAPPKLLSLLLRLPRRSTPVMAEAGDATYVGLQPA
mmetsp:Transcript_94277/g.262360  ORF Transcript_94277/g.262360 Transcript_94277/m.262360 type:complete len:215 (+) Transcript_94277:336-980(+)